MSRNMSVKVRYSRQDYDDPGVEEFGRSDEMRRMLRNRGNEAMRAAERASRHVSGSYNSAFEVVDGTVKHGRRNSDRAAVIVRNSAPSALAIESRLRILNNAAAWAGR